MLTRRTALGLIGASSVAGIAPAQARFTYDIVLDRISDGIWMLEGATEYFTDTNGGAIVNIAALRGDTGLILIDTGPSLRYGQALDAALRKLDLRGVSAVFNTHHHPDHFLGNQAFVGRPIYGLPGTVAAARRDGDALSDNMYRLLGDWMRGTELVPPTQDLGGGDYVIDGRQLRVLPLGGHTEADMAILDVETGTLIAGDLAFYNRAPTTPTADLPQWYAALDELEALRPSQIIPGHGPLDRTGESLSQTRDYLMWMEETFRQSARDGLDMIEVMGLPLPEEYASMGAQPQEYERSVSHLFADIEIEELPRAN